MVAREAAAKTAIRSIYFWNNGFKPHNPFKYVVRLKFKNEGMSYLSYNYNEAKSLLQDVMSEQASAITGLEIRKNVNSTFISFSHTDHMYEFLASDDNLLRNLHEKTNFTKSIFEPRHITANTRPFHASVGLAYRPSLHSTGRIISKLLPFGELSGTEIVDCPYDPDRRIMYCSYFGSDDMVSSATQQPTILGKDVSLGGGQELEDVHVWKHNGMVMKDYGNVVMVRMGTLSPLPVYEHYQASTIIKMLEEYGEIIKMKNWFSDHIFVTFADPISVFKLFWKASPFGRVIMPVPNNEPLEFHMNIPRISKEDKQNYSIDIRNVHLNNPSEDLLNCYCADLLDSAGCNAGFISGVYSPEYKQIFLRLSNPWYTRDVSMKLDSFLQGVSVGRFKGLQTPIKSPFWDREPSVGNSLSSE